MAHSRTCDECGQEITERRVKLDWDSGTYSYPTPSGGRFDFCDLQCLKKWVDKRVA